VKLPLAIPFLPMEAKLAAKIPSGEEWQYEPKWDGFRCLAFGSGDEIELQSKAGQPLTRYFPEIVEALDQLSAKQFVLDGELIVPLEGHLSFDALLQRIHPAASRVVKLSKETPARFILFDLVVDAEGESLVSEPLSERRKKLEKFAAKYLKNSKPSSSPRRPAISQSRSTGSPACAATSTASSASVSTGPMSQASARC